MIPASTTGDPAVEPGGMMEDPGPAAGGAGGAGTTEPRESGEDSEEPEHHLSDASHAEETTSDRTEPVEIDAAIAILRSRAGACRDWHVSWNRLEFATDGEGSVSLKIPHATLDVGRAALKRACTKLRAPYTYLKGFPDASELARHLTILARAREGAVTIRAIQDEQRLKLRGFLAEGLLPFNTWMLLEANRSLIEVLPGYEGVMLDAVPAVDGSTNRARILIPIAENFCADPPIQAAIEIDHDECGELRIRVGCGDPHETGRRRFASLSHTTLTIHKKAKSPLLLLKRTLRALKKTAKGVRHVRNEIEQCNVPCPMTLGEIGRALRILRAFPQGFPELLLTRHEDHGERSTLEVFLTLCDTARTLPDTLRWECERKAWVLLMTGFSSVLAFRRQAEREATLVQMGTGGA